MRIVVAAVQIPFQGGGAELLCADLARGLRGRGHDVDVLTLPFLAWPKREILTSAYMWRMLDLAGYLIKPVDAVIATKFPSYCVEHPNKVAWLFHQYRDAYDVARVIYAHLAPTPEDQDLKESIFKLDQTTLAECRKIFTISEVVSDRLKTFNGMESEPLFPPPPRLGSYYTGEMQDYVLFVGRLEHVKRGELLIEALTRLPSGISAVLVGYGDHQRDWEHLVHRLGLGGRVRFAGRVGDAELLQLFAEALAVFFGPYDEDYGFVTLEAFLSKVPVITCRDSGGVLSFVRHEENGFVVDPEPEALADAIQTLHADHARARCLGEAGYERVKDITWDPVLDKLEEALG